MITVLRYPSEADCTVSEFYIHGTLFGFGIEDEHRSVKVKGETRIPNGIYTLSLTHSPRFSNSYFENPKTGEISKVQDWQFTTPHNLVTVNDVPGFSRILWHWGNTDLDSSGCYIVGAKIGEIKGRKAVLDSRKTYERIYPVISSLIKTRASKGLKTLVEYKDKILT